MHYRTNRGDIEMIGAENRKAMDARISAILKQINDEKVSLYEAINAEEPKQ